MQMSNAIEREEDRELITRRVIDAPRELVFRAWTEARHLARWFGPHGFTTTTRAFEFRPGGVWDFDMIGPDGTVYPNYIEWETIDPPERITYEQGERANDPESFHATVTFLDRDGQTEIVLRALLKTKAQRDHVVEHYGAIEGGRQTLERLATYVAEGA
jgi:uncharacterized protein YndB with AHSA1/START domain